MPDESTRNRYAKHPIAFAPVNGAELVRMYCQTASRLPKPAAGASLVERRTRFAAWIARSSLQQDHYKEAFSDHYLQCHYG
eukprot:1267957-Amphidinium_carterae.1